MTASGKRAAGILTLVGLAALGVTAQYGSSQGNQTDSTTTNSTGQTGMPCRQSMLRALPVRRPQRK
jgi:hypothetical protein